MQPSNTHLDPERLAAFDVELFTADEQSHLSSCAVCRAELGAVQSLVTMAAAVGAQAVAADAPRLVEFDVIAAGLRTGHRAGDAAEPLRAATVRVERGMVSLRRRTFAPLLRRVAAALLLVSGGAVLGRMSGNVGGAVDRGAMAMIAADGPSAAVRPVALAESPFADRSYGTVDDATAALNRAQREYERASLWLASNDTTMRDPEVFRARLAALDQMMEASRVALRDAPQDPVLNHYYLAAYSAREATLQALGGVLPVDKIIDRY